MTPLPRFIFNLTQPELEELFDGLPKYRHSQIINWVYKNFVFSPMEMINIPTELRKKLASTFIYKHPSISHREITSDKTEKYLLELYDKENIEFVIISAKKRNTFCLSTQVGCPVKCKFCASGAFGLTRNLFAGEIVAQFLLGSKLLNKHPDNVVFMGIGEPLLNLNNLLESLEIICSPEYINYGSRRITISTSGIPDGIVRLAEENKQWNLAVSIHATDDKTRARLIPEAARFPLNQVLEACKYYFEKSGRIVTLEYTLLKNVNDSLEQADKLAKIAEKLRAKINLIPYNPTNQEEFESPDKKTCNNFESRLKEARVHVTSRVEKGRKISAACGQLRITGKNQKN